MAPFFAALRKDFPSTLTLHAFAEAVFFVTAAHMGLKRTFRQRSFSSIFAGWPVLAAESAHRMPFADPSELRSVFDRRSTVKEAGRGRRASVKNGAAASGQRQSSTWQPPIFFSHPISTQLNDKRTLDMEARCERQLSWWPLSWGSR